MSATGTVRESTALHSIPFVFGFNQSVVRGDWLMTVSGSTRHRRGKSGTHRLYLALLGVLTVSRVQIKTIKGQITA